MVSEEDLAVIAEQLGRVPRGVLEVSYRCPDGSPGVVLTSPRLPDGTPFPTLYYLTDPRLTATAGRFESVGTMAILAKALASDPALAEGYRRAHEAFLAKRDEAADRAGTSRLEGTFSAGGMPDRVKCLHALIAHSLSEGPGLNPVGDIAVALGVRVAGERQKGAWPQEWPSLSTWPDVAEQLAAVHV
ncbi:DUF501 domain-containing protein [Segniliparus rugosus]|uniref:DUF501 domain-containing protein n=1 Tax=Segniliparus rugosus (strain ATCC BAA-974 / DSM 45345 / CCUG 50838 / CIP 108380 / JCM 13579 / CDC 945) TaxID=679197 RepID=E5XTF3_SEGRC|nr:DUF501 domain-containing protein [Segniliparus rugosus]EFV12365.1 hypothetical protein HMPREF9336_02775 [Segniliparus rugosus ATCC BAA-974]